MNQKAWMKKPLGKPFRNLYRIGSWKLIHQQDDQQDQWRHEVSVAVEQMLEKSNDEL